MVYQLCAASRIFPDFLQWGGNAEFTVSWRSYFLLRILQLFHSLTLLTPLTCVAARGWVFEWFTSRKFCVWQLLRRLEGVDHAVKYCVLSFWGVLPQPATHPLTARAGVKIGFFVLGKGRAKRYV